MCLFVCLLTVSLTLHPTHTCSSSRVQILHCMCVTTCSEVAAVKGMGQPSLFPYHFCFATSLLHYFYLISILNHCTTLKPTFICGISAHTFTHTHTHTHTPSTHRACVCVHSILVYHHLLSAHVLSVL